MEFGINLLTQNALAYATTVSIELIILVVLTFLIFIYSLRFGKNHLVSLLLSIYIGFLLLNSFPYFKYVNFDLGDIFGKFDLTKLLIFVVLVLLTNFAIKNIIDADFSYRGTNNLFGVGILSLSSVTLIIAILYGMNQISISESYSFFDILFSTNSAFFWWWFVAPLVALFIAN